MNIEYYHASKYGNGVKVAEEFMKEMGAKGITVNIHHVPKVKPKEIPKAELYLFSSPGRFGGPAFCMRRFLKKVKLPSGTKYAILVTELAPKAGKNPGEINPAKEPGKCQRVISSINQRLQGKGMINIGEGKILVTGLKGPLEEDWQKKVGDFSLQVLSALNNKA